MRSIRRRPTTSPESGSRPEKTPFHLHGSHDQSCDPPGGAEAAKADPSVAKYIVGWRQPGEFGFIAEQNGEIVGAAWARRFSAEELKFPYGDEEAPKVSIGVKPNARGRGVGEKLMRALIGEADRRGLGLCLSVRSENPARHLYERLGFRDIRGSAVTHRAGGTSIGMALRRS